MQSIDEAVATEGLTKMVDEAKRASDTIKVHEDVIRVISHYDADGISSAAIIVTALTRLGKKFRLSILRQFEENFIKDLGEENNSLYIVTDMGSGQIDNIKKYMQGKTVIICDHHQPQGEPSDDIIHINSLEFGMGENMSGAGVAYILAQAIGKGNQDLSELAIIGAIGDSQIDSVGKNWGLNGMNKEILKDAESSGKIRAERGLRLWGRYTRPLHKALEYTIDPYIPGISGSTYAALSFLSELGIQAKNGNGKWRTISDLTDEEQKNLASGIIVKRIDGNHDNAEEIFGDVFELLDKKDEFRDASEFATMLNSCGKTGRADLGVRLCMNDDKALDAVRNVISEYRKSISTCVRWVQKEIKNKTENVVFGEAVYILAKDKVPQDIISNVMSIVNHSHIIPEGKPLFGFADGGDSVKVSARLDKSFTGGPVNLKEIVSIASKQCGGEGGGHAGASGARIIPDSEDKFISIAENLLKNLNMGDTINEDTVDDLNTGSENGNGVTIGD